MKRMDLIHVVVAAFLLVPTFFSTLGYADPVQFSEKLLIAGGVNDGYIGTSAEDMNDDGIPDILAVNYVESSIIWIEHYGDGAFGPENVIATNTWIDDLIDRADVTGDGLEDIVYIDHSEIMLLEALDNAGSFGVEQLIATNTWSYTGFDTGDVDSDEDTDLIAGFSFGGNQVQWYQNVNGQGSFELADEFVAGSNDMSGIELTDIDSDGDGDILIISENEPLWWHENIDGEGYFSDQQQLIPSPESAAAVCFADIDGDQDNDLVAAHPGIESLYWYENTDGNGTYGDGNIIGTELPEVYLADCADMDNDGDNDVISVFYPGDLEKLVWFENLDGAGSFGPFFNIATTTWHFNSIEAVDFDNDLDFDVLCTTHEIFWIRNDGDVGVAEDNVRSGLPAVYSIRSVSPNPFNATTSIEIALPSPSQLTVKVYNMLGQEVVVLHNSQKSAGIHTLALDASHLTSGVYFVHAVVPGKMDEVRKVVLMK